jgi:hypothetical protein
MGKPRKRPKSILRLKVSGPHIKPGRIPIPELLVICEHAQAAVNRQAEVLRGKRGLRPGPTATIVKTECTLELFSIGRGSAALSFAGPEPAPQPQTDLDLDIEKLGEAAVRTVVTSLRAAKRGRAPVAMDIGVKRSLEEMGKVLNNGVSKIEWIAPAIRGKQSRITAVFDDAVYERISETHGTSTRRTELDGRLEMADFKLGDLKCIIHTPDGQRVPCSFTPEIEDDVYKALRHIARVSGTATINAKTKRTEQIALSSVQVLDPFLGPVDDFFAGSSIEQLTKAQGVDPRFDLRTLKNAWPEDEDVETFLAAIEQGSSE